jgi:hypothetical protein
MADLPIAQNPKFFDELRAVSSGTWASLTGVTNYDDLAHLETDILTFYLYHQDGNYKTWMDVWHAYRRAVLTLRVQDLDVPEVFAPTKPWVN